MFFKYTFQAAQLSAGFRKKMKSFTTRILSHQFWLGVCFWRLEPISISHRTEVGLMHPPWFCISDGIVRGMNKRGYIASIIQIGVGNKKWMNHNFYAENSWKNRLLLRVIYLIAEIRPFVLHCYCQTAHCRKNINRTRSSWKIWFSYISYIKLFNKNLNSLQIYDIAQNCRILHIVFRGLSPNNLKISHHCQI
jgi:hypothetical protein